MKNQQSFSHGLLYSVAPDNFSELHLNDENETGKDKFEWGAYESQYKGESLIGVILGFLKTTAVNWGIIKLH